MAHQPLVGQGLLIIEASRSHSNTRHSIGLLWMSDQPDAVTSTEQHTTLTRDGHSCSRRIRTYNPANRASADPHLTVALRYLKEKMDSIFRISLLILYSKGGFLEYFMYFILFIIRPTFSASCFNFKNFLTLA
jgi:hypothetical protein